jgi:hypothetical protein
VGATRLEILPEMQEDPAPLSKLDVKSQITGQQVCRRER